MELKLAADNEDTKTIFAGLNAVYGPRCNGITVVRTVDCSRLLRLVCTRKLDRPRYVAQGCGRNPHPLKAVAEPT